MRLGAAESCSACGTQKLQKLRGNVVSKIFLTRSQWGGATLRGDGKVKPGVRKPRDASEAIRMKKSKKKTVVTRAKAKHFNQPK